MEPLTGVTSKIDRTWRLIALGRRYLLEVDTKEIDVAELTRFVTTWRSAFDEPMTATDKRVDELAVMIATAGLQSVELSRPFERRPSVALSSDGVSCRRRVRPSEWRRVAGHRRIR
jgi:hypothetical protein